MSFLFSKKPKNLPTNGLPPVTRDISSSHGLDAKSSPLHALRDADRERRGTVSTSQPTAVANGPMNGPMIALKNGEPHRLPRERSESDLSSRPGTANNFTTSSSRPPQPLNNAPVAPTSPDASPYPWSQKALTFSGNTYPFPRYGAAINAIASKQIYIMGGLVGNETVQGDLWMIDLTTPELQCSQVATVADGPGPRVGHASLLAGNAFIVFGGDTKHTEGDELDETLYLLNTKSRQWSKAHPDGIKPPGRYGHTINLLGHKLFIFGGQVEGNFFNDLYAFDLDALQNRGAQWELLVPNGGVPGQRVPRPRTNHTVVSWDNKLYLFGGTDGIDWFNDVWTYNPATNTWSDLDCIGYIPSAREGHAAALVGDTMYIFGGRVQDGTDLGDLVAFKISTRRWYMFQKMGSSPSPRSGHSMAAYGSLIMVLAGEPSSPPRNSAELRLAYVLDTSKIRYPNEAPQMLPQSQPQPQSQSQPQSQQSSLTSLSQQAPRLGAYASENTPPLHNNGLRQGSRNLSSSMIPQQSQLKPLNKPPALNSTDTAAAAAAALRSKTPSRTADYAMTSYDQSFPNQRNPNHQPLSAVNSNNSAIVLTNSHRSPNQSHVVRSTSQMNNTRHVSNDSDTKDSPRGSLDHSSLTNYSRDANENLFLVDSGVGMSPALSHQNEELIKELEAAKSRNAWYASELAMARKSGYQLSSPSGNPLLDQQAAELFNEDDRHLIEALLRMQTELATVQESFDTKLEATATKIAEVEKQRDIALSEAAYYKLRLAAHSNPNDASTAGSRGMSESPENERANDLNKKLAASLASQGDLNRKVQVLQDELDSERKARQLAEETAEIAFNRIKELDVYKQCSAADIENLRANLHETQKSVREESTVRAEAVATRSLLEADNRELQSKHTRLKEEFDDHSSVLDKLREAMAASTQKVEHLEGELEIQAASRTALEQDISSLRAKNAQQQTENLILAKQLQDAQNLASQHALEAKTHREAVLSGLEAVANRSVEPESQNDERVGLLHEHLVAANNLTRQNKDAADMAAEKLRSAEERIAGLEAYQEQTSRENLAFRKQTQSTWKDLQTLQAEKADLQGRLDRAMLDSNALEVQLKTLKSLLVSFLQ